jgi:ribosomal protein L40E
MNASDPRRKRTILTEDGELRDVYDEAEAPAPQTELIYCNQCGTSNSSTAKFCRKCGHSLLEQEADVVGTEFYNAPENKGKKGKRLAERDYEVPNMSRDDLRTNLRGELREAAEEIRGAFREIRSEFGGFKHEQQGEFGRSSYTEPDATDTIATVLSGSTQVLRLLTFAGMGVCSMIFGAPWIVIFLMLFWFLVEAVNSGKRSAPSSGKMVMQNGNVMLVAGIVITSMIFGSPWVAPFALLFWFLTEAVHSGNNRGMSIPTGLSLAFMTLIVAGVVIPSFIFDSAWIAIPTLVFWFLMNAVRSGQK